jgi:hypothetical protein
MQDFNTFLSKMPQQLLTSVVYPTLLRNCIGIYATFCWLFDFLLDKSYNFKRNEVKNARKGRFKN